MAEPSRMIICEGPEDAAFLHQLINNRGISYFKINDTAAKGGPKAAGNTKFGEKLVAIQTERWFKNIEKIVLLTDCDESPESSFQSVADQVNKIKNSPYGTVAEPIHESNGRIKLSVYLIPGIGFPGNLETLCCNAARSFDPNIASKIDDFSAVVRAEEWGEVNRISKFWLRVMLATCCERDPFVFLKNVFSDHRNHALIPLNHSCFNDLSDYLREISD